MGRAVGQGPLLHAHARRRRRWPGRTARRPRSSGAACRRSAWPGTGAGRLVEDVLAVDVGPGVLEEVLGLAPRGAWRCSRWRCAGRSMRSPVVRSAWCIAHKKRGVFGVLPLPYQPVRLRFSTRRGPQSCADCTSRAAKASAKPQIRVAPGPSRPAAPAARPGRRSCCGGPRAACAASPERRRTEHGPQRGQPLLLGLRPPDEDRRRAARAPGACPSGRLRRLPEQLVGRQARRARDRGGGSSRSAAASRVARAAASAAGRAPGLGERPRQGHGPAQVLGQPRRDGQPLPVVVRRPPPRPAARGSRRCPRSTSCRCGEQHAAARLASPRGRPGRPGRRRRRPGWPAGRPTAARPRAAARAWRRPRRAPGGPPRRGPARRRGARRPAPRRSAPARLGGSSPSSTSRPPGPGSPAGPAMPDPQRDRRSTAGRGSGRPPRRPTARRPGHGRPGRRPCGPR